MNKDTIQATLADLHIGSQYSICADRFWQGMNERTHSPKAKQQKIIEHWNLFADTLAEFRKGKRLKLFLMGDLIEGTHHGVDEAWTTNPPEMQEVAVEIIGLFQKRVKWQRGDELYCLRGTYVHTEDYEEGIGKELNAVVGENGYHAQDKLKVETNGKITWAIHQGASVGQGATEGNPLFNQLKNTYLDSLKNGTEKPDIMYSAHFHKLGYAPYGWRKGNEVGVMHGIVSPGWKMQDRYSAKAAKFQSCGIGGMMQLITTEGVIDVPKFVIM